MKKKKQKIPLSRIPMDMEIKNAVISVLDKGNFILGAKTEEFEKKFAKYCDVKYAACVSSGTTALFLALKSMGVKKNDEIIIPSLSFVATATPILMCGAIPKFAEINSKNYTINPSSIMKLITKKTKGIIPVHLYGHPANMDEIKKIGKENALFVLEDSAQAHGAKYKNHMVGSLGNASCFSFYPSKNLTVCGDGGIVVSDNHEIIEQVKKLRNHGRTQKYIHETLGYNFRFNEIQAAIGLIMLKRLTKYNNNRRRIAKIYNKILKEEVITPREEKWARHVYHMYTIRTKLRNKLQNLLKNEKISTGIHYPIAIHNQPIFSKFAKSKLKITEDVCKTTLSLPMFPSLKIEQAKEIAEKVRSLHETLKGE